MEEEHVGLGIFCNSIGFKFVINLCESIFSVVNALYVGSLFLYSFEFLLFYFLSMADFEEHFFKCCDTYTIGSDAKIVQIIVELLKEFLKLF